jgi:hypothetical protein
MTFAIYDVASGGVALYTKSNVNVSMDYAGVYYYEHSGLTLPFNANYFLGVTVANDSEMSPRINVTSNGYAYRANVSDTLVSTGNYTIESLKIAEGNLNVTAGNITYVDRNGKIRVIQDTTQGVDEEFTNTLLDKSRSTLTCAGSQLNYTLIALNGMGEWNFNGTFYGEQIPPQKQTTSISTLTPEYRP